MKRIVITQQIRDAIDACARAEACFVPGRDAYSILEIPKLALADAVLAAVSAQQLRPLDRQARIHALPKARPASVRELTTRSARRRRA